MSLSNRLKKEVSGAYDAQVSVYEKRRFSGIGGELFDRLEKLHVLRWLDRSSVLQIGTATGRFAELLGNHDYSFCGIEISRQMSKVTKKRGPTSNTEVVLGDGESLPFSSVIFDNVLSVRSFHFLPEPREFMREAYRVLCPSGRLIVSFEMLSRVGLLLEAMRIMPRGKPTRTYYTIGQIRSLFNEEGFTVLWWGKVTKFPLNFYWKSPQFLLRVVSRFHPYFPSWFGTVGSIVGMKN